MLNFTERMFVTIAFRQRVSELTGRAFEDFFQEIMARRYPDFLDIRTHGDIGDMGADGLWLSKGKLHACYAPEVVDPSEVRRKVRSDIRKARLKRASEFKTFVFTHNDLRGMHPVVGSILSEAARNDPGLAFEQMRPTALMQELFRLPREEIEDVLGVQIAIAELVFGIGLDDLKPLLDHLVEQRMGSVVAGVPDEVPPEKMAYNGLGDFERTALTNGMSHTHLVKNYYDSIAAVLERDEVAASFSAYYREIASDGISPEEIFFKLQMYVTGNARQPPRVEWAVWVVIAFFFESCDLFEAPPVGWVPGDGLAE